MGWGWDQRFRPNMWSVARTFIYYLWKVSDKPLHRRCQGHLYTYPSTYWQARLQLQRHQRGAR